MKVDKAKREAQEAEAIAQALEAQAANETDSATKAELKAQASAAHDAVDAEKMQLRAAEEAAAEDAAEAKDAEWRTLKAEAEEVFYKVSGLDGEESGYDRMTKACLLKAQR